MPRQGTHLQLCGRFSVVIEGRAREADLPGRRARALVGLLAARHPYAMERGALAEAIWPDTSREGAAASLTVLLSKTRAVLGRDVLAGRGAIALRLPTGGTSTSSWPSPPRTTPSRRSPSTSGRGPGPPRSPPCS